MDKIASDKIEQVLSAQKPNYNKTSFRYTGLERFSTSPSQSTSSEGTIKFVPLSGEIGETATPKPLPRPQVKTKLKSLPKRKQYPKTHRFCHHCGAMGHTCSNCFKLQALKC